jgi:hypothetical protein
MQSNSIRNTRCATATVTCWPTPSALRLRRTQRTSVAANQTGRSGLASALAGTKTPARRVISVVYPRLRACCAHAMRYGP